MVVSCESKIATDHTAIITAIIIIIIVIVIVIIIVIVIVIFSTTSCLFGISNCESAIIS